jgi:hypothetical protein
VIVSILASAGAFATAPALLAVLLECIVLLSLRVWAQSASSRISPGVLRLLTSMIVVFVALFGALVVVRFETLA